ncbi:MAG: TetR/AcrR family transcriptional regulator [Chloroflexota bacterium]
MDQVEDKRQAILDATLRLISVKGFHGTAMSKVAKEAGVSTGIIYHYFESKDELIYELYRDLKLKSARIMTDGHDVTQPVRSQIQHLLGNVIRYSVEHPQEVAYMEQYNRSPYYHPDVDSTLSEAYKPFAVCFTHAKEQKVIKDLPYAVITAFTTDVATSLAQKQARGVIELTPKLIEQVIEAAWEAIRQ